MPLSAMPLAYMMYTPHLPFTGQRFLRWSSRLQGGKFAACARGNSESKSAVALPAISQTCPLMDVATRLTSSTKVSNTASSTRNVALRRGGTIKRGLERVGFSVLGIAAVPNPETWRFRTRAISRCTDAVLSVRSFILVPLCRLLNAPLGVDNENRKWTLRETIRCLPTLGRRT